jgi:RND superfamily putative drug exporter
VGRIAKLPCGRVTKWLVVVFWVAIFALAGPLAGKLTDVQENDAVNWLPASAESTQVYKQSGAFQNPNEVLAVLVYERVEGITGADREAAEADAKAYGEYPEVKADVLGPIDSGDGKALQVIVPVDLGDDGSGWERLPALVDKMTESTAADDGLTMYVTGPAGINADFADAFAGIDGMLFFAALGVVVIILLLSYRSPILWLLPVISAVIALVTAQGVVYLLAKEAGLTVNAQSQGILTVLVFGAGTDYALLLVARYREELRRHADRHEAMAFALHRAGPAIFASGATVLISMLCLVFAEMNSTAGMGPVLAVGIGVGLAVMLTLLPALLVIVSRWVFWPVKPTFGTTDPTERGMWAKVGRGIAPRPRKVWVTTTLLLVAVSFGVTQIAADGLKYEDQFTGTPDSIVGAKVLDAHFPSGTGSPVLITAKESAGNAVAEAVRKTQGIVPESVVSVPPKDGLAFIKATLVSAPDSRSAERTIDRVRAAVHAVPGSEANVGGDTAVVLDTERASNRDTRVVIPIVLVVVFLILALLLQALVVPIILIATVVLSFVAAFGISAIVFTHVLGFAGTDAGLPLFAFVFLVALGIDYNIFLMTRVREETRVHGTRRGALVGLSATGAVITSAGLVLAGTFAVLATLPVVMFAEMGFLVAVGVLLDTLVVRSILVTALTLDIGRHMWWPSRLGGHDGAAPPTQAISSEPAPVG